MVSWLLNRNYNRWFKYVGWLQWNDHRGPFHPQDFSGQATYSLNIHRATLMLFYVTVIILVITALTLILAVMQFFCPGTPPD